MGAFAYQCNHISKSFGGVQALKHVSLTIQAGEIRALFGGNGSGKSTLAKILGGYVKADAGEVSINGKILTIRSPQDAKSHGIIVTSQELSLFYNLTAQYNISLSVLPRKAWFILDKGLIRKTAEHYLGKVGEAGLLNRQVLTLPENNKYLLEFAKALAQDIRLLIVDEITSSLFSEEFNRVNQLLVQLKKNNVAVIFISHRMNEVYTVCDSITVLRNGQVVKTDAMKNISKEELLALMTGNKRVVDLLMSNEPKTANTPGASQSPIRGRDTAPVLTVKEFVIPGFTNRVNLDAHPGEFIGISGLRGQGQSQLVRALFGLCGPKKVLFQSNQVTIRSPRDAIKKGIGFISGNRELEGVFPNRSVKENLEIVNNVVLGRGSADYCTIIHDYKIVVSDIEAPIKSLSGGNQQKVVIARWLTSQPKLLLADDPNKGVDVQSRSEIHDLIRGIIQNGGSVVMVSSDDEELVKIGKTIPNTKIHIMYDGEIVRVLEDKDITLFNIVHYSISKGV